jgi:hypothetical protein
MNGERREERKQSFFEKKDQKAFVHKTSDSQTRVFCFFFAKKKAFPGLPSLTQYPK